jgi:hypothetical protein
MQAAPGSKESQGAACSSLQGTDGPMPALPAIHLHIEQQVVRDARPKQWSFAE